MRISGICGRNGWLLALLIGNLSAGSYGAERTATEIHPFAGQYEDRSGNRWTVVDARDEAGKLGLGMPSGQVRALTETSREEFTFGPAFLIETPVNGRVHFGTSGETARIELGKEVTELKRVRHREKQVNFRTGAIKLAGTLVLPNGSGPFPVIVDVHGSGPATRHLARAYGEGLVQKGYAFLAYDKRGCGGSEGDLAEATLDDFADDVASAVRFAGTLPEIDSKRMGVWGHSQGGWVGVKAARREPTISFLIARSGPATSPAREGVFEEECRLRFRGVTEAELREAAHIMRLDLGVTRGTVKYPALEEAVATVQAKKWFSKWDFKLSPPDSRARRHYGAIMDYDPSTDLKQLKIPMLWLYGGLDMSIPVQESIAVLVGVKEREKKDITVEIFPRANHSFFEAHTGADEEMPTLKRLIDMQPVIEAWLEKKLVAKKSVSHE